MTTRICSGLGHTDGVPSPAAVTSGRLQYAPTGHTAGSPLVNGLVSGQLVGHTVVSRALRALRRGDTLRGDPNGRWL